MEISDYIDYLQREGEKSYVVMGAVLKCKYGERLSFLIPDASTITYTSANDLLLIPETATKPEINVINFGECQAEGCKEPCAEKMKLAEKWVGCISATESDGVKVLVDGAELDCHGGSAVIEISDNGQNSSIEDVLANINDKELTNKVRQSILEVTLYRNKEELMDALGLKSDADFEKYVKNKLEMIPKFPEYYDDYLKLIENDEYGGLFLGTRDNPLYEFMFLMDDMMAAHFTFKEREDILKRIMDGESTYKLEKEYGSLVDLHLAFVAIFNFGGRNEMMQAIIQQDMANSSQNFQQLMGLFIYTSILGINDGSGPPSMDYYDHSGTWIGGGDGGFNFDQHTNSLNGDTNKSFFWPHSLGAAEKYVPTNIKKVNDRYLKSMGIDAHEIKKEVIGDGSLSKYDIYVDNDTGMLLVYRKGGIGEGIPTYEYIK